MVKVLSEVCSLSGLYFLTSYLFELPDELKSFFSKYGKVVEHQIIHDHETNRSRGFGFVIFESEEVVDELLSKGNMVDIAGTQVSLFKWRPKKPACTQSSPQCGVCIIIAFSNFIYTIRRKKEKYFIFNFFIFHQRDRLW